MYDLFTDRARKAMQLSNQEALRLNHEYIDTGHILLGLIAEGQGVAANVLKNVDLDLSTVRIEVEKHLQAGTELVTRAKLPTAPRGKKVIEYSMEEARRLNHNYVGTEHMLLGLLRESEGVAAIVLKNFGLKLDDVREDVLGLLGHGMPASPKNDVPPRVIEDLPDELKTAAADLDALREQLRSQAEHAVKKQEFDKAAALWDRREHLWRTKLAMVHYWIVNRPINVAWLSQNDGAALKLAQWIAEHRRWDALPGLANALERAGCSDTEILSHCRQGAEHSSQCWVVDALLAKAAASE